MACTYFVFFNHFDFQLVGAVRGCGRQKIGAIVNLGSYYLIGIPLAAIFAFVFHIGGKVVTFTSLISPTTQEKHFL